MFGIAKDPLQHTSMYERMEEGIKAENKIKNYYFIKNYVKLITNCTVFYR